MEIKGLDIKKTKKFWTWFSDNCVKFGEYFDNEKLLNDLDNHINKLGDFTWEIGPGISSVNQLTISPGGNVDLLSHTKEIISYAPAINEWEFYYAKPPKEWNLIFDFEKHDGNRMQIDASNWNYVILRYDDGMFEIIFQTTDFKLFSEDDKLIIAEILVDSILGEEFRMLFICAMDIVSKYDDEYLIKSSNIKNLDRQLKSLT